MQLPLKNGNADKFCLVIIDLPNQHFFVWNQVADASEGIIVTTEVNN